MTPFEPVNIPMRPSCNPERKAAFKKYLLTLRAAVKKEGEVGIRGLDNMAAYLTNQGLRNGLSKPITGEMVKRWIKLREFPAMTMRRSDPLWTTNVLILAWLWSFRIWQRTKPYRSTSLRDR